MSTAGSDVSLGPEKLPPTPLEYEASCTDTVQRIRNGELHAAGDFGDNMVGFVRVRWNGCGQDPTVGFGVK